MRLTLSDHNHESTTSQPMTIHQAHARLHERLEHLRAEGYVITTIDNGIRAELAGAVYYLTITTD
jgi:hypothetical protein